MNKWPGASFLGSMHQSGAQNKTLISNTAQVSARLGIRDGSLLTGRSRGGGGLQNGKNHRSES